VDNQLDLVISLYEAEEAQLEKLVESCLFEHEHLMAHHHSRALNRVGGRLTTLYNLRDGLYNSKEIARRGIESVQRLMETELRGSIKEYLSVDLERLKERLAQMEQVDPPATQPVDERLLLGTIGRLMDGKVKNLKLVLKESDNLLLKFTYSGKAMKLTLPYVKSLKKKAIFHSWTLAAFQKLGFVLSADEARLALTIRGDREKIMQALEVVLSKIVFEVFYYREFSKQSYLAFREKGRE
jgi:uncharacterized membrane protein